jgi:hypothetical protein
MTTTSPPAQSKALVPFPAGVVAAVSTMTAASVLRKPQELMAAIHTTRAINRKHLQNWQPHEAVALIVACRSYQDNLNKYTTDPSTALVFKGVHWDYIATKLVAWPLGSAPRDGKACKDKMQNLKSAWVRRHCRSIILSRYALTRLFTDEKQ